MLSLLRWAFTLLVLLSFLQPSQAASDPPARVGRLSLAEGGVLFRTDREDPGSAAMANWPVSSGAILDTEHDSRAEAWIGSTAFRLGGSSRLEFALVDDHQVRLQLAAGILAVTVRDRDEADDIAIITPQGRVRFFEPGRYRVEVLGDRTTVAAQSGMAEAASGGQALPVRSGEMAIVFDGGRLDIAAAPYGDDFDGWVTVQDNRERSRTARQYVSPHMTGYQDLDVYGDWDTAAEYGTVWYPRAVAAGWAPYRYGRWAWIAPWGWTWIDAAPWGFAPFHYGRWVLIRGRWGWAPGAYVARPVYAPALVGWVGNPGWSVGFSFGSAPAVGWFPLAPREVYVPAYRTSPTYIRRINVTHVTNVMEIDRAVHPDYRPRYAHHGQPQAVTVVPANILREGRPIDRAAFRQPAKHELHELPVATRAPAREWLPPTIDAGRPALRDASGPLPGQMLTPGRQPRSMSGPPPAAGEARRDPALPPPRFGQDPAIRPVPEGGRVSDGRGGVPPPPDERAPSRPLPTPHVPPVPTEAPRGQREARPPQPVSPPTPSPIPHETTPRPLPQAREPQQPGPTIREAPRDGYRELPRERPMPMVREIQPPTPMPRELRQDNQRDPWPRAPAAREMQQAPVQREAPREIYREAPRDRLAPPVREAPRAAPPPASMREMPRVEQRPPLRDDRGGSKGHDDRRGDRDQR